MFGNLPLTGLRAFEALARSKSPLSAANELSVTPGAVTRQVRELETLLDCRLFDRQRRQWQLTSQGEVLARAIASNLQSIRSVLDTFSFNNTPPLRIGISRALATFIIAPRLTEFLKLVPGTVIYFDGERQGELPHPGLDLVVRYGIPQAMPAMDLTVLPEGGLFPAAAPSILPVKVPAGPWEWPETNILSFLPIDHWSQWFAATGYNIAKPAILHFSDSTMLFEAAVSGVGLTMAHSIICHRFLQEGSLVSIGPVVKNIQQYYVLANSPQSPAAKRFVEWLSKIMTEAETSTAPYLPLSRT